MFVNRLALATIFTTLMLPVWSASGAVVTLDQDTMINSSNSFPEPPPAEGTLFLDIADGPSGSPIVQLVDGGIIGGFVSVRGDSHLVVTGGRIEALTTISDQATLTLEGGLITPSIRFYASADVVGVLEVKDQATLNLKGSDFFGTIFQDDSSNINIFGTRFVVDGELPSTTNVPSTLRVIGFYADGDPFDIEISRLSPDAKVILQSIPEPSSSSMAFLAAQVACACGNSQIRRISQTDN